MLAKLSHLYNYGEFDDIYQQIINNSNMQEVKKEQRKNFVKSILCIFFIVQFVLICLLGIFIENNIIKMKLEFNETFFNISFIFMAIGIFCIQRGRLFKYKEEIIQKLILAMEYEIKYKTDYNSHIIAHELYTQAGFREQSNRLHSTVTDYMEYELDCNTFVKLADIDIKKHMHESRDKEIFEGIAVKITRKENIENSILIERNKLIKGQTRIKDENEAFEKYFDLYAENMNNVDNIITANVKEGLIKIYEEYGVTFEIAIKNNFIYIRFFTGPLFESKNTLLFSSNKKKLHREYIIFKTILDIIRKINELIYVSH